MKFTVIYSNGYRISENFVIVLDLKTKIYKYLLFIKTRFELECQFGKFMETFSDCIEKRFRVACDRVKYEERAI